jgi:hypothetical protein
MDNLKEGAAKRLGVNASNGELKLDGKSMLSGMGGWLGVVETILPSVLFGSSYAITKDALTAVLFAGGASLVFIIFRLFSRKSASSALVGALAVGFAAWLVLRDGGQAADYFIPGFYLNATYGLALMVSILVRWPLIGVLVEILRGNGFEWRTDSSRQKIYSLVTLLWVLFFSLRLSVQVPLYLAGKIELLATARVLMGPPLYALVILSTYLFLRATVLKSR